MRRASLSPVFPQTSRARRVSFLILLLCAGCAKRSRPAPPPQIVTGSTPDRPSISAVDPSAPAPVIEVHVDPERVVVGESATLEWRTQNADIVIIDHDIGAVDPAGRLKVFPDVTTRYWIRADGPGGSSRVEVQIEVRDFDQLSEPEAEDLPITQRFSTFVEPIFFEFDSTKLSEEAELTLDGNVRWLNREDYDDLEFVIEGHCDSRGSESYNLALGDSRAQTVREYLIRRGVDPNRILTLSLGEERPTSSGDGEAAQALNRRAQFVMISEE